MEVYSTKYIKEYGIPVLTNYLLNRMRKLDSDYDTSIYAGIDIITKESVAFKLKLTKAKDSKNIYKEFKIYMELLGINRIPKMYTYGTQGNYTILIMELLGPSLKQLLKYVGGKFNLSTTLKVGIQVLDIIKEIHNRGVVLRYIKPGNIVKGKGKNKDYIYLIDFEIAKKYIRNGLHKPYKDGKKPKGNRDYVSLNTHLGIEISRRDDIESLGYNLIYFIKGELPWTHKKHNRVILSEKLNISLDELCEGLPEEIKEFIKYAKELKFDQQPDYYYLKNLLLKAATKHGIDINKVKYDWDIKIEEINKLREEKIKKENEDEMKKEKNENGNEKNIIIKVNKKKNKEKIIEEKVEEKKEDENNKEEKEEKDTKNEDIKEEKITKDEEVKDEKEMKKEEEIKGEKENGRINEVGNEKLINEEKERKVEEKDENKFQKEVENDDDEKDNTNSKFEMPKKDL